MNNHLCAPRSQHAANTPCAPRTTRTTNATHAPRCRHNTNATRRLALMALTALTILVVFALTACDGTDASGKKQGEAAPNATASANTVTIGTLATEDILPMWVAEAENLFAAQGISANIVTFQSATELIAGITSGEVDLAMTDIMVTASVFASGTNVQVEWITLGTDASQGRFGIMTNDPSIKSLQDLAGKPIGVGSNTILEYVMDRLMTAAGVPADQIVTEELQKLPVRYQTMASGQVPAAALPGSLLALGQANGCTLVADDTTGENISQSIMIARAAYLDQGGTATVDACKKVWDQAAAKINANPESYRALLVSKANLSDAIANSYPISTYPTCQLPTQTMVDDVLSWMKDKGYLTKQLAYNAATGTFSAK